MIYKEFPSKYMSIHISINTFNILRYSFILVLLILILLEIFQKTVSFVFAISAEFHFHIPSISYWENSVYLHECSPFWVGIFITFNKENYHVYRFMCILIDKALKH